MEKWEIEVKENWNKISDSEWYQSLRTDDRLSELYMLSFSNIRILLQP